MPRRRKLDREALRAHVRDQPDALLRERVVHFGVHLSVIDHHSAMYFQIQIPQSGYRVGVRRSIGISSRYRSGTPN